MAAYKEACTFGDLANGPFPPHLQYSQKYTKKFLGMFKNKERNWGSEVIKCRNEHDRITKQRSRQHARGPR